MLRVCLYVAGGAPNSIAALASLRAVLAAFPEHPVELEIVDVVATPERGFTDGVMITPMLRKLGPAPERRVLGNLRDHRLLREVLGFAEVLDD
ncbi:MAG: circadian clock KaiB family protein [Kofleriaceae bacterium]